MDSDRMLRFEKLDIDNYASWSFEMEQAMIIKGYFKAVEGEATPAIDKQARAFIVLQCKSHH